MKKILAILVLVCVSFFASCASAPKKVEKPADLYVEGVNLMNAKKYDKAIEKFIQIRENFPFDPISFIATVKLGDAYFEKKDYVQAVTIYEDFFNAHPEDENIPYVLKKLGECYERLSLSFDRDQAYTIKAIERYTYLLNRYPTTTYAKEADKKRDALIQKIIDREIYIGEFYYKTFQYNAAITRLEYVLKKYPNANGTDKVLYFLAQSYKKMGNHKKAEGYYEQLRSQYPDSRFLFTDLKRQRKSLKIAQVTSAEYALAGKSSRADIELKPQVAYAEKKTEEEKLQFFEEKKPIDIISDSMEGMEKEKYVIFKGNVVAKQGELFIYCDSIEAYMNQESNEIEKAYAKGNVKIVKGDRISTCKEAIFDNKNGIITLKGDVVVFSGQDKLTGDVIKYYINEERVVVESEKDKKARIRIIPK